MRIFQLLLFFLFLSSLFIISNENLHLKNSYEAKKFADLYYAWLYNFGSNIIKTTGYVVKFEWLPNNNNTKVSTN